eukprot:5571235-Amphidinium_carterae.1
MLKKDCRLGGRNHRRSCGAQLCWRAKPSWMWRQLFVAFNRETGEINFFFFFFFFFFTQSTLLGDSHCRLEKQAAAYDNFSSILNKTLY